MAKLFFICGRICTGKTTLAERLKKDHSAVSFSADEWMLHFFDEHMLRQEFDRRLNQCREMIYRISGEVLDTGVNVALDFGFWTRLERDMVRQRFNKHEVIMYYTNVDIQKNMAFLERRNAIGDRKAYHITREMYNELSLKFEEPGNDEEYIEVK